MKERREDEIDLPHLEIMNLVGTFFSISEVMQSVGSRTTIFYIGREKEKCIEQQERE
jgi:hypothetical protein